MDEFIRWNLMVSRSTDVALRMLLAERGGGDSNMSGFVEEAVNREVLRQTVSDIRARNANTNGAQVAQSIDAELSATRKAFWPDVRR